MPIEQVADQTNRCSLEGIEMQNPRIARGSCLRPSKGQYCSLVVNRTVHHLAKTVKQKARSEFASNTLTRKQNSRTDFMRVKDNRFPFTR
jgi:hypothetical protein